MIPAEIPSLFPWSEYAWFYVSFTAVIGMLLLADLGLFHRSAHVVSMREATIWSIVWVGLAVLFGFALHEYAHFRFVNSERLAALPFFSDEIARQWANQVTVEFFTGYVIEKSLSIDNLFVFVMVFRFFAVPAAYQHRILFFGIIGALISRAVMIALGSALMEYEWLVILMGVFLILSGAKLAFAGHAQIDPEKNILVRGLRRLMPVYPRIESPNFFKMISGKWHATPLFLCLVFVEATDVVFAVDSVPAIFAVTKEPMLVFTSNIFAILGLRSLYFLLANAVDQFYLLKYGLALVLVFVGSKMAFLNSLFGGKFPVAWSLGIIAVLIGVSVVASLLRPRNTA